MSGGANTALYVVDSTGALTAAESVVEGRLTAAGLTVTRVANSAAAPADVNDYSIVVVAKAATDANLSSAGVGKYVAITAPMLWMHSNGLNPETATFQHYLLGSTASSQTTASRTVDILTVHQSTGSLAVGTYNMCSIASGGLKQYMYLAPPVAGAVARINDTVTGDVCAFTIESCGELRVGTAPNRRMVLGWFGAMWEFNVPDTLTVLDGAIAWCLAGVPCPTVPPWSTGSVRW